MKCVAFLLLAAADPLLPTMPEEYSLKVTYSITTAGKKADYLTARNYNLKGPDQYREDDWVGGVLAASTIELPSTKKAAYRYNVATKECISWEFVSTIDGFPLLYRAPPYIMAFKHNETVASLETNVFEFVFTHWWDSISQKFVERTYTVWFLKDKNVPVQIFDSMADVDGHTFYVSEFADVDDKVFEVPEEWSCKDPSAPTLVV